MKLSVNIEVDGGDVRDVLRAFNQLPKDANAELRVQSQKLSELLAAKIAAAGHADAAPQSSLVATTTKAKKDRVPVIDTGGTRRLGRDRAPAYKLLYGSVFGSNSYRQFHRPHRGTNAYWIFPQIEENQAMISRAWNQAADDVVAKWGRG